MGEKYNLEKEKNWYLIAAMIIAAVLMCTYAFQLSVPAILDETIAMGDAAWITGRDWSLTVAALGGLYFRYVQSLLTVPFFAWMKDPAMIYRASMVLQALLHVTIIPVVYTICRRHLKITSEKISVLLATAVCFVPSAALYVLYYRGDFLLYVLPWYVLLTVLETMKAADERKTGKRIGYTVLTILLCVLCYGAHTRGIVILIAVFLCVLYMQIFQKQKSLHWPCVAVFALVFLLIDYQIGSVLKDALYSVAGANANTLESVDMGNYFNLFSYESLKDVVMLCISWMHTLVITTDGLVLIGVIVFLVIAGKVLFGRSGDISVGEKTVSLFSFLVFAGYYAVGALFFKGTYLAQSTGALTRRTDRLLYDRYSICGAGMIIFIALYILCWRREWMTIKSKILCLAGAGVVGFIWLKKILPVAVKYPGYIFNTITLNTFQNVSDPSKIITGQKYSWHGLLKLSVLAAVIMFIILLISCLKKKWVPCLILVLVLISDLALIQINYVKIRKAANDYLVDATTAVVDFMQSFEDDVTADYPYILKGKLSGVKIQFYQSQLMEYKMFGKDQEEQLALDNYFIISDHDDIDLTWYSDDYYLFEEFDYAHAEYDIVYVKGEQLAEKMEALGYHMIRYGADPEKQE